MEYRIFVWTDKLLRKQFSAETVNKYGNILGYLYQNGFELNCEEDEIEEELELFNFFQTEEDLEELRRIKKSSDFSIGKKIFAEELYDIVKSNSYVKKEADNPVMLKVYAESNWGSILTAIERVENLLNSKDSEIVGILKTVRNLDDIRSRIDFLNEKTQKGIKVLTWLKFSELIGILYSLYIQYGKTKTDQHKLVIASNLNDELYGGIGGYNPTDNSIKCIIGSAVYDVKICKAGNKSKIRSMANAILKQEKTEEDEEEIKFLEKWSKGEEQNDEYAQQVVVNSLLHGILTLLNLKYNINFLKDKRNSERALGLKNEFLAIMKYCNIDENYLL